MNSDIKILIITLACVTIIPFTVGFIYGYYTGEQSIYGYYSMLSVTSIIILPFTIWMAYIFYNEAKIYSNKPGKQTILFWLTTIPIIMQIWWMLGIIPSQITYWIMKKYYWENN
jgi:hypothetical protein